MCCTPNLSDTFKFLKQNKRRKTVKVYKVLRGETSLYSPYQYKTYKPGVNNSNSRRAKPLLREESLIEKGIHVFLNRAGANYLVNLEGGRVVEFIAKIKDFICVGRYGDRTDNAVFRRVYLSKKEYDRLTGGQRKTKTTRKT